MKTFELYIARDGEMYTGRIEAETEEEAHRTFYIEHMGGFEEFEDFEGDQDGLLITEVDPVRDAAPDLLKALEDLITEWEKPVYGDNAARVDHVGDAMGAVYAAVFKAKGPQPCQNS